MTPQTFALMTPEKTHYVDVIRVAGDDRAWRDLVLSHGVDHGLITPDQSDLCTVLPANRPPSPKAHWR